MKYNKLPSSGGKPRLRRLFWLVLCALCWETLPRITGISPLLLPPLSQVVQSLVPALIGGSLVSQIFFSLKLVGLGLLTGTGLALLLLYGSFRSPLFQSLSETLSLLLHPLAGIALLPLVILWWGTGSASILAIIVHSVVWPLLTTLETGRSQLPEPYILTLKNYRIRPIRGFIEIILPGNLPYAIAGLKIAWARSWRALISAEMIFGAIGGQGGLGWFIYQRRVFMDTDGLYAGLLVIIGIGLIVEDLLFGWLDRRLLGRWRVQP